MAKWSEKMAMGNCPYCNCMEGQMHDKLCRTQIGINWGKVGRTVTVDDVEEDDFIDNWTSVIVKDGYDALFAVLRDALDQAQNGKGSERHGNGQPFTEQPALTITRAVGIGFPLGQAMKKIQESQRMDTDAAKRELLGAINYLAAAILSFDD